jgi:hypothetical protein
MLARKTMRLMRQTPAPAPEPVPEPIPDAPVAAPVAALGEAPCSANVRVMIDGREVQITLRGTSEDEVLERLHAVLRRSDVRPLSKPQPRGSWRKTGR